MRLLVVAVSLFVKPSMIFCEVSERGGDGDGNGNFGLTTTSVEVKVEVVLETVVEVSGERGVDIGKVG